MGIASGVDDKSRRDGNRCEDKRMAGRINRDDDSNMLEPDRCVNGVMVDYGVAFVVLAKMYTIATLS
jgi:hypothetical protein